MSDKSEAPRTDAVGGEYSAGQWEDYLAMRNLAAQLERELAAERDAHNATANNLGKALTRAEKAEAECERLRNVLKRIRDTGNWWEQAQAEEALATTDAAKK